MTNLYNASKEAIEASAIAKLERENGGKLTNIIRTTVEPLTSGLLARVIVTTLYHGADTVRVYAREVI